MPDSSASAPDHDPSQDPNAGEGGLNLRIHWLMVWERKWYALSVFIVVLLAGTAATFLTTPKYDSFALVQVLRRGAQVLHTTDMIESSIVSDTDFNTQLKVLESGTMCQNVAARLSPEETKLLTEPFKSGGEVMPPAVVIQLNRKIIPQRLTLMLAIQFRHPNPDISSRIANLFAEEYIAYNSRLRVEETMKVVDELKDRADQQRKRVEELANALQAYRQRDNLISLVQSKDIVTEKLKTLNLMATQTSSHLSEASVRWKQVQEWIKTGRDLSELPGIAIQGKVAQLVQQLSAQRIALAQIKNRYKEKHPRAIEAANSLAQTEAELRAALENAAASIRSEYESAVNNDNQAQAALREQETKSLQLDKFSVEYDNLTRELRVNEQLLEVMLSRMRETSVSSTIETQNARIIDRAGKPIRPVSPNVPMNLAITAVAAFVLGLGSAYLIAITDDRVKNAFDVETLVDVPLISVVPKAEQMDQSDKAQLVSNGADPMVAEAFTSLCAFLRVGEASRQARTILVTSTMPGEGKSFIATNLALSFASQGFRTVIIDCDLRKPNIDKSFRLEPQDGVIQICQTEVAELDDYIVRDVVPNLDVLTSGGRAKNPTGIFNNAQFESLMGALSKSYDRVVVDTPPLGAVSDALLILPLVDGVLFGIHHNRVHRRAAQSAIRRIRSTDIPILGAVLNGVEASSAGTFYGEYIDKSYKEYYVTPASASEPKA